MRLKFEKNIIHCRVSQIEATELLQAGALADTVTFPSGHVFTYRVEVTEITKNVVSYAQNMLCFEMTRQAIEGLMRTPSKKGLLFLQDSATYAFEIDIRKERRKKPRNM